MLIKILFVCTGNICRSPTAHAIARHKIKELKLQNFEADSAGVSAFHSGEEPDSRAIEVGKRKNIDFSGIEAKQIDLRDFEKFDLIFGMDRNHISTLRKICPEQFQNKIHLFLEYSGISNNFNDEIKDPYYGGVNGFVQVFDLIEEGVVKIINHN